MTQHQLTHVLIKAVGVSSVVYSLPNFIYGGIAALVAMCSDGKAEPSPFAYMGWSAVGASISICVGLIVIRWSKPLASWLFPDTTPKVEPVA